MAQDEKKVTPDEETVVENGDEQAAEEINEAPAEEKETKADKKKSKWRKIMSLRLMALNVVKTKLMLRVSVRMF